MSGKFCSRCGVGKDKCFFHKSKNHKDGFYTICIECRKKERETKKYKVDKKNYDRMYKENNRDEMNARRRVSARKRWKEDVAYRLKLSISHYICFHLKWNNGVKNSPTWKALPYTPQQLKEHLESQWVGEKSWMTWENHGLISGTKRTWNIDHITPQSLLPFDSFSHPNFLKCWNLSNLQPLEAKENVIKGNKLL